MAVSVSGPAVEGVQAPVKKQRIRQIVLNLENCILTEDKLNNTPSMQDGLDREVETDLRFIGCEFIQTAGILLKLPQVAMATGQVLYQRFYYSKSFVGHNFEIVAMACVVLASKIEEAPRRVRDVLNVFHHMEQLRRKKTPEPLILDQHYMTLKNQVIKAERRVLKELGFCVHVKHPHKMIVTLLQTILLSENNDRLVQIAWNYMNDSLRSDVFVRHPPETIACACISLAARMLQIPLPTNPNWYEVFRISEGEIEDVAFRIFSLYARPEVDVDRVDKIVKDLRAKQQEEKRLKALGTLAKTVTIADEKVAETTVVPLNKILDSNTTALYGPVKKVSGVETKGERDRYKDEDRHRDKDRSRDRTGEKSREREKSRDQGRDRSRERARERSQDRSKDYRRRSSSSEDRSSRKKRKRRSRDRSRSVSLDRRRKHRHRRSRSRPRNTSRVY
ncbi:cyclin-L1 [Galendromus occidentalis]|uniref:Cyclin-L1 n=1 Tax=Galendromus occidentalis TaxID=34638 RepID=A0AAJ6QPZ6_9ACAR|nr:cyclin-L1 [Galendromus occidentalis]